MRISWNDLFGNFGGRKNLVFSGRLEKHEPPKPFTPNYWGGIAAGLLSMAGIQYFSTEAPLHIIDSSIREADGNHDNWLDYSEAQVLVKRNDFNRNHRLDPDEKANLNRIQTGLTGPYVNQLWSLRNVGKAIKEVEDFETMQAFWGPPKPIASVRNSSTPL